VGTFTYTTGQPLNLAAGKAISFPDLSNSFADVKTFLTGANLDATNMAASVFSPYQTIQTQSAKIAHADTGSSGTYFVDNNSSASEVRLLLSGTAANSTPVLVPLVPNDFAIAGLTTRLRLGVSLGVNATAPACNFTFGLYSILSTFSSGAAFQTTVGSVVTGSTITRNTPSASTVYRDVGSDFAFPTGGAYVFGAALSAGTAANNFCSVTYTLQVHWV
jgi:hypothetical protein